MNLLKERKFIMITGMSGTGKTKLSKYILNNFPRVIISDSLYEYKHTNYVFSNFAHMIQNHLIKDTDEFNYIFWTKNDDDIEFLCQWAMILENVCIVIDEFERYLDRFNNLEVLIDMVRRGRHSDISLILISQRVPDLSPSIRSQVSTFITFKQEEPADLDFLLKRGFDIEKVKILEKCEGINFPKENINYLIKGESLNDIISFTKKIKDNLPKKSIKFAI